MVVMSVPDFRYRLEQLTAPSRCLITLAGCKDCVFTHMEIAWLDADNFAVRFHNWPGSVEDWVLETKSSLDCIFKGLC